MTADARRQKPVLVTGASKGIGRAIALRLGAAGFPITAHYGSDRAGAESVAAAIKAGGGEADVLGFDVRDREATQAALETKLAQRAFWGVVLSAGVTRDAAFPAIDGESWDYVLRTNLDGFYNVVHPLTMPMIRRRDGGRIIAITSVSGLMGNRGQASYSASKAGIMGAAKALAVELATRNITVNCIAPGLIETDMTKSIPDEVVASVPMRRMGTPEEVAGLAEFLFSDDAAYITRQTISVNGGLM
jgi:3-oxoacyl-[acyl-carrier protein] reductase